MLVYEKVVNDERHLFATSTNIPSNSDSQLSYRDEVGNEVEVTNQSTLIDDGNGGIYKVNSDGTKTKVNVWVDNINIIPGGLDEGVSTECKLLSVNFGTKKSPKLATINEENGTITFTLAEGMVKTALKPIATISPEATGKASDNKVWDGSVLNLTSVSSYTVTAEDGTTSKTYTLTINNA